MDELALAPRQRDVLRAIDHLQKRDGFSPSIRELADELGLTALRGVAQHLEYLKKKGAVRWLPHKARTLAITDAGRALL